MTLERAPCGVCGAAEADLLFRSPDRARPVPGETFPVGRCRRCGHLYLLERPPASEIGRYYFEGYAAHRSVEGPSGRRGSRRHGRIVRPPPFRILDVGCGSGYDLLRFRDAGCELFGIEPDPRAAAEARRQGITVSGSAVEAADFPDASFDVVTMIHALEHTFDPAAALANLRRMSRPHATVHLVFPTADGLAFRLFRRDWYHLDVPRHLHFFTHRAFARLCREAGFRIVHRGCRSGMRGLRRSLSLAGERCAAARGSARAVRVPPFSWILRVLSRGPLDALRWGDVAEYVIRPAR